MTKYCTILYRTEYIADTSLMQELRDQADKVGSKANPTTTHWTLAMAHMIAELEYGALYFWLTLVCMRTTTSV